MCVTPCVFIINLAPPGHVSKLVWNQDGQCLASLSDSGKEICLSAICGKSEATIGVVRGIVSCLLHVVTCISIHFNKVYNNYTETRLIMLKTDQKNR